MNDLKACAVCFSTDIKLYCMDNEQLGHDFQLISGLEITNSSGLPNYLCFQCTARLKNCIKFRAKCQRAHYALLEILNINKQITKTSLSECNHNLQDIMPPLTYMNTNRVHFEQVIFDDLQWTKQEQDSFSRDVKTETVPVFFCSNWTPDETSMTINENIIKDDDDKNEKDNTVNEINIYLDEFKEDSDDEMTDSFADNDNFSSINKEEASEVKDSVRKIQSVEGSVEGSIEEEYALLIPMTDKEAKAVVEVNKMYASTDKIRCVKCTKAYVSESLLNIHMRMHDKHISGHYHCEFCDYYYKTELVLNTHITEKHMYKYVCKKCPEVNFERILAKRHYKMAHYQSQPNEPRPSWLGALHGRNAKGVNKKNFKSKKRVRGGHKKSIKKKKKKDLEDFIVYTPIGHEEQYAIVQRRQHTKNYREAKYQCDLCFIGFLETSTYANHMKKHDPKHNGKLQCDVCKLYFKSHVKLYKHVTTSHIYKFTCEKCDYVSYNKANSREHSMFHKNVTYKCPHCDQKFSKSSTRISHIRIKHPSLHLCNLCGHSFVSEAGLACHQRRTHSKEEIEISSTMVVHKSDPSYCADCDVQFLNAIAFDTHLGSSYKHTVTNVSITPSRRRKVERLKNGKIPSSSTSTIRSTRGTNSSTCEVCGVVSPNDVQARKHHESAHPDTALPKHYMCDVCGHTTRQYANLVIHMRNHTDERPYSCPHCDKRFKQASQKHAHLVVHTGERRYQCHLCDARFTQSGSRKLHIKHVHLKMPDPRKSRRNRKLAQEEKANTTATSTSSDKPLFDTPGDYLDAYMTYNEK